MSYVKQDDDHDDDDDDDAEFSADNEAEPLSEEDEGMIAALLDIPAFAGAESLEMEVVSWADGTPVGTVSLAPSVFGVPVRRDVVNEVVRWQLARRRSGNGQVHM